LINGLWFDRPEAGTFTPGFGPKILALIQLRQGQTIAGSCGDDNMEASSATHFASDFAGRQRYGASRYSKYKFR
jgi:hypothetical protein